jgi:bacterioferritin (cytochrome b1)
MSNVSSLLTQLNSLLRLTHTERMIAETRRAQATSERFERELSENADKCAERARLLADAIRDLGGVPDVVGTAVSRVGAAAKTTLEQGQSLEEALLGDLALEHQLHDRARFARMIADELNERNVVKVLDRLDLAHGATIDWLMTRLAEVAVGGPAALRPSPLQSAVGVGRRLSQTPVRQVAATVNRTYATANDLQQRASERVGLEVERSRELLNAAAEIWTAGRDASLRRAEDTATDHGAKDTARNVNRVRRNLGAVDQTELPIRNYDSLRVDEAVVRIDRLREADQVRTVLAYEAANKNRKGVVDAATNRIEVLAAELAQVS